MAARHYFSAANILSQKSRERFLNALKLLPSIKQTTDKKAAVLVPLCMCDGEMSLLYTLRSMDLSSHKGDVSFPGGKFDLDDIDMETTALRETEEELGIHRDNIEIWGTSKSYPSRNFELAVTPVYGFIKNFDTLELRKNPAEVEEAFTVPLEKLCDPQYFSVASFKNGWKLPQYEVGPYKIWGLTSIITHVFLSCLLPEEAYPMRTQEILRPKDVIMIKPKL